MLFVEFVVIAYDAAFFVLAELAAEASVVERTPYIESGFEILCLHVFHSSETLSLFPCALNSFFFAICHV